MTRQTSNIPTEWLRPSSLAAATVVQRELARRVVRTDSLGPVHTAAGVDISHNPRDQSHIVYASWVVLDAGQHTVLTEATATGKADFPYVSGYLGFREVPTLIEAFAKLAVKPDLVFVDGHGISHPRGLGIASHLGVLLDIPTIGVAKSILVGKTADLPGEAPGATTPLIWRGETMGMAVRMRRRAKPVYVSTGHRISLESAVAWVLRLASGYRLPEPTRLAHLAANAARRDDEDQLFSKDLISFQ